MNKRVELPLIEPIYKTYHNGLFSAVIKDNPSIRNYYLNEVFILTCNRKFLSGYTTPVIDIKGLAFSSNLHLEQKWIHTEFLEGCVNRVIRNFLDKGYYVYFNCVDDYYVEGKSNYKTRHFPHDGTICGYDQNDKTYCIYAYDTNWMYNKFWTTQKSFNKGRKVMREQGEYSLLCGIKPKDEIVEFDPKKVRDTLIEYLDSDMEKYPEDGEGNVFGIVVHDYIAKYVDKLFDESIPYSRIDSRVFRIIWEQKKFMLERLLRMEEELDIDDTIRKKYEPIVKDADHIRMLYASHTMRRRDGFLPVIKETLLKIKDAEKELLEEFLKKIEGKVEV